MPISESAHTDIKVILSGAVSELRRQYGMISGLFPICVQPLGDDRDALYSFVHQPDARWISLVFKPVAERIARDRFSHVEIDFDAGIEVSSKAETEIESIIDTLAYAGAEPHTPTEHERIRSVIGSGETVSVNIRPADICVTSEAGITYCFDLFLTRPDECEFRTIKENLLRRATVLYGRNPDRQNYTAIAYPYNLFAPEHFERWMLRGVLDFSDELYIADEFWDFLGGEGTFIDLITLLEEVGLVSATPIPH